MGRLQLDQEFQRQLGDAENGVERENQFPARAKVMDHAAYGKVNYSSQMAGSEGRRLEEGALPGRM